MGRTFVGVVICIVSLAASIMAQGHGDRFAISIESHDQGWTQTCYNSNADEYLVVWEDYRGDACDVYGQFVGGDGTLKGSNFAIAAAAGHQAWPRLDFDPVNDRVLVVFEHHDQSTADVRGVFVNANGTFYDAPTSLEDHTFGICTNPARIYTCSVAFNPEAGRYLAVWGDFRNDPTSASFTGADVYGQLIDADGTLLPPPSPADPSTNFAIATSPDIYESVADVTFSMGTCEWFVVYGTSTGLVCGQRVDLGGDLIDQNGGETATPAPIVVSKPFQNGPDCFQARVKANCEGLLDQSGWYECEVVWKGKAPALADNDVWGQRIGFFNDAGIWVAKYVGIDGAVTDTICNHPISIQNDWVGSPDIDYSVQDNEFLVAWGDPRTNGWSGQDLYYQRLWIDTSQGPRMVMLADDRLNTVTETENIPVFTTPAYEGSLLGIAHSVTRNEFLVGFTYVGEDADNNDIMGVIAHGSPPVNADDAPLVDDLLLGPCTPNPFGSTTTIRFNLPRPGAATVTIRDLMGRTVATLAAGVREAGPHAVLWEGTDERGVPLGSGVYLCGVRFDGRLSTQMVSLIR
ncbi:MAG: hypothetical protein MUE60_09155 [Candidatus Eisenbacteria bacterium]|nr:hypothetical protein [Candidatus Eisenbacteria bacterium]